jgi:hypothetical protein
MSKPSYFISTLQIQSWTRFLGQQNVLQPDIFTVSRLMAGGAWAAMYAAKLAADYPDLFTAWCVVSRIQSVVTHGYRRYPK